MSTAAAIAALPAGQRPTISTLRHLFSLKLELQKKIVDGPWDRWDGELLVRWDTEVDDQIRACSIALEVEMEGARQHPELIEVLEGELRWLRARGIAADDPNVRDAFDDRAGWLYDRLQRIRCEIQLL